MSEEWRFIKTYHVTCHWNVIMVFSTDADVKDADAQTESWAVAWPVESYLHIFNEREFGLTTFWTMFTLYHYITACEKLGKMMGESDACI